MSSPDPLAYSMITPADARPTKAGNGRGLVKTRAMTANRDELHHLVDELPDADRR